MESSLKQANRLMLHKANLSLDEGSRIHVPNHVELTPTETKVVQLVAKGLSNREVAEKLSVSRRTIESHVSNMLNKTSLKNRTELACWAMENSMA